MPLDSFGEWVAVTDLTILDEMAQACEDHYQTLVNGGCDASLALDRVWDVWDQATSGYDRGVLFEGDAVLMDKLESIVKRSAK